MSRRIHRWVEPLCALLLLLLAPLLWPRQGATAPTAAASDASIQTEVQAAEKICLGLPVDRVELQGCLGTRCQPTGERERFIHLLDLEPNTSLRAGALKRGIKRLERTRFFQVKHVRCQILGGRARVSVTISGNNIIRKVQFVGNRALFTSELRNKVQLQPGDVLNPNTERTQRLLLQQRRALQTAYSREGFDDVDIRSKVAVVGVGQVELQIIIREGARKRVSQRTLRIADPHRPTERERRAGLVCAAISERALLKTSGLMEVDVFTRRAGVRARGRIRERLRAMGYGSPRVDVRHNPKSQEILVRVRLGRCAVIRTWTRQSAEVSLRRQKWRANDDQRLAATLPFSQSGVFDVDEAERGRRAMLETLNNRGYLFADVRMELREVPRGWNSRVLKAISYYVTKGYQTQIRGLTIPGASHFSQATLRGVMRTKPYDLLDDGGYLQPIQMLADLELLRKHYRDAGFYDFDFELKATEEGNSLTGIQRSVTQKEGETWTDVTTRRGGFRIRQPDDEPFIYVDVPVSEGRRTRLTGVKVFGAEAKRQPKMQKLLKLEPGDVVSHALLTRGLNRISDWYAEHGYFQAQVKAYCRVKDASSVSLTSDSKIPVDPCQRAVPPDDRQCPPAPETGQQCGQRQSDNAAVKRRACTPNDWCPCTAARILAASVDVRVRIDEGKRVKFGEVFVSGNFVTETDVVTNGLPDYDSPYSGKVLFEALRKIRNLGLFRSVSFERIGADECPPRDHIALMIRVVEGDNRTLDLDGGFQTANVNRGSGVSQVGEPPPLLVDILEHMVSAGARLNTNSGQRIGARLPQLVLTTSADYRDRNFWGLGHELRGVARLGFSSNFSDLSQQPISLGLGALSYTIPRLPYDISLKLVPFVSRDFVTTTIDIDKIGAASELSKRFGKALSTSLGVEGALVSYRDATTIGKLTDWRWQFKAIVRANYDATDSPINPTEGLALSTSVALINATIEDPLSQSAINGGFLKIDSQLKWHLTLRKSFTLAVMLRGGYARVLQDLTEGAIKQAVLPANEAFRLGGQLGVRGLTDNGVLQYDAAGNPRPLRLSDGSLVCGDDKEVSPCPQGGPAPVDSGNVLLAGTVEGRFPVLKQLGLWGAAFWDWGGIGANLADLGRQATYRHTLGLGLRFLISGQIPLRLDYGIPLERRCLVPVGPGQQCPQREEFGQLQVGLLYAF